MHIMAIHWVNCVSDIDEHAGLNGECHHDRIRTLLIAIIVCVKVDTCGFQFQGVCITVAC